MSLLENHIPVVRYQGLNSEKDGTLSGVLAFSGANTHSGSETFSGGLVLTGKVTQNVEVVTATNVITAAESGKTFFLDAAGGFESTLPTAAAGLTMKFIVKTAPTSVGYTITGSPADKIFGIVSANGAETEVNGVAASASDNVLFVANQAAVGDWVDFMSDGTNWYVTGAVSLFAGITANG